MYRREATTLSFTFAAFPQFFLRRTHDIELSKKGSVCIVDIDSGELDLPEELPEFPYEQELIKEIQDNIIKFGGRDGAEVLKEHAIETRDILENSRESKAEMMRQEAARDRGRIRVTQTYLPTKVLANLLIPSFLFLLFFRPDLFQLEHFGHIVLVFVRGRDGHHGRAQPDDLSLRNPLGNLQTNTQ